MWPRAWHRVGLMEVVCIDLSCRRCTARPPIRSWPPTDGISVPKSTTRKDRKPKERARRDSRLQLSNPSTGPQTAG